MKTQTRQETSSDPLPVKSSRRKSRQRSLFWKIRSDIPKPLYYTIEIFVGIISIGVIGLEIDYIFKLIFKLAVPWAVNKV